MFSRLLKYLNNNIICWEMNCFELSDSSPSQSCCSTDKSARDAPRDVLVLFPSNFGGSRGVVYVPWRDAGVT